MDPFEKEFHTKSREVRLSAREKDAIRASVLSHAAPIASPYTLYVIPALRGVAIALSLVIVVAGPLTYGAQRSGPGDALYAFEMQVVEPVEASLQLTQTAKRTYHAERLAERLVELRTADREKTVLTTEESNDIVEDVAEHAGETSREDGSSAERILPQLIETAALLAAHEKVLDDLGVDEKRITDLTETLEGRIEIRTEEYLESTEDADVAAGIASKIDRAEDTLPMITSRNDAEAYTERFDDIADAVAEGKLDEAYEDATELEIDLLAEEYFRELSED